MLYPNYPFGKPNAKIGIFIYCGSTTTIYFNNLFHLPFNLMKERDKEILKEIGAKVLKLRLDKNLSQDDLASRCDVDRGKISKIETGSANYYITTLVELAKGLGVDPKELIEF